MVVKVYCIYLFNGRTVEIVVVIVSWSYLQEGSTVNVMDVTVCCS